MKLRLQSPYSPAEGFHRLEEAAGRGLVTSRSAEGTRRVWVMDANVGSRRASFALAEPGVGNLFRRNVHVRITPAAQGSAVGIVTRLGGRAWLVIVPWALVLSLMVFGAWATATSVSQADAMPPSVALAMAAGLFTLSLAIATLGIRRSQSQERVLIGLIRQTLRADQQGAA